MLSLSEYKLTHTHIEARHTYTLCYSQYYNIYYVHVPVLNMSFLSLDLIKGKLFIGGGGVSS